MAVINPVNIYSNKFINILALVISIILFISINLFINKISKKDLIQESSTQVVQEDIFQENNNDSFKQDNSEKNQDLNWYLEIPSISLKAPIQETTEMDVLEKYVGHFEETATSLGNIGLAGHNSGYENNYFKNLNKVKKGDEILYKYDDFEKAYIIEKIKTIKNTDWSYLENTKENRITLITCIDKKPKYRLCVQAIEK